MATNEVPRKFTTFQEAFCHRFGVSPDDFERKVFFKSVSPLRLPLVVPLFLLFPERFDLDLDIIEQAGKTRSKDEFSQALDEFHNAMRVERSKLKKHLGMRMSGSRLMDLRDELDPLIERVREVERPVAKPAVTPAAARESTPAPVAARAPTESRALVSRRVRQAHAAVTEGRPLAEALASCGLSEPQFLELLATEGAANPAYRWLHAQLERDRRLAEAEAEIARLNRAVTDQSREIADLRDRLAKP